MKLIRKPVSLILALIMILTLDVPLTVFAEGPDDPVQTDGQYTVTVDPLPYHSNYGYFSNYIDIITEHNGAEVTDSSFGADAGDTVRISSHMHSDTFPCNVTGMTVSYVKNGRTVTDSLELTRIDRARNVAGEFTVPAADVTISFTVEKVYFVNIQMEGPSSDGTVTADYDRAIGYDKITLTVEPLNPAKPDADIYVSTQNGHPVELSYDNTFIMPTGISVQVNAGFYKKPDSVLSYIRRSWDAQNEKVVSAEEYLTTADAIVNMSSVPNGGTLEDGKWYYVNSNVTFENRIYTDGHVRIILGDGFTVNFKRGISVEIYDHLEIFAQKNGTGKMIATSERFVDHADQDEAAIGADSGTGGNITFHGGNFEVKAKSACKGAAIGGGGGGSAGCLTFYAGTYKISNNTGFSAGIGGGYRGGACGFDNPGDGLIIYGGDFDIYSYSGGAAIGNGAEKNGSTGPIVIYGGTILARGHNQSAGIGGGKDGRNGYIFIYGGEVSAISYASKATGAGIGSGGGADQGDPIYIYGGTVAAQSTRGAGIGGSAGHNGGTVNIRGGVVIASSSAGGAGIGGGNGGSGGTVDISDGVVIATSSFYDSTGELSDFIARSMQSTPLDSSGKTSASAMIVSIAGLIDMFSDNEYSGAGIGGGHGGNGGNVSITGGTVIAQSGLSSASSIGHGKGANNSPAPTIADDMKLSTGSSSDSAVVRTCSDRERYCLNNKYSLIEKCGHENATYQCVDETGHRMICSYCNAENELLSHVYDSDGLVCTDCGYERVKISFLPGQGSGSMQDAYLTKGDTYTLPANGFTAPSGKVFEGWLGQIGSRSETFPAGTSYTFDESVTFTAQFADSYKLWVGGQQVTDASKDDILGLGKITFDPATCTLNFDNVTAALPGAYNNTLVYAEGMNLTITGSAVLSKSGGFANGIRVKSERNRGSLTISGDVNISDASANGIYADKDIVLAGGTIYVSADVYGIRAGRKLFIQGGVTRVASYATAYYSLYYNDTDVEVDPSLVITEYSTESRAINKNLKAARRIVLEHGTSVTFVLNGGTMNGGTEDVVETVVTGTPVERPDPDPTRKYVRDLHNYFYGFGGWYADEALTTPFDFTQNITEDTRVYAKWTRTYQVHKKWYTTLTETKPDSVTAVLQHNENGAWTTVQTVTLNAANNWEVNFEPVGFKEFDDSEQFRVRELDKDGSVVLDPNDQGGEEEPIVKLSVGGNEVGYLVGYEQSRQPNYNRVEISNASYKEYRVEKKWDSDIETAAGKQDRPDNLDTVLQRRKNWFKWETVEILTLNRENNWNGKFKAVPVGYVDDSGKFQQYKYRVRELKAEEEDENGQAPQYNTEEERLEAANDRVVHDKWDFDKPFLLNLIEKVKDPSTWITFEPDLDWVKDQAKDVVIPSPTVEFKVAEYTDFYGENVEEHTTKYNVKYSHDSTTHKMTVTNTAVLEFYVHSWWLNFKEEEDPETGETKSEIPESCYVMLESKMKKEYTEKVEAAEYANIYTPVFSTLSGGYSLSDLPGVSDLKDGVKTGIQKLMGDSFIGKIGSSVLNDFIMEKIGGYLKTGVAIAKQDGKAENPLNRWTNQFTVKKYGMGEFKLPMDYAAAELVTGLIEMILDAAIKYFGIQNVHVPVMYQPIDKYWSVKGYAIPLGDTLHLCNIINTKFHGDDDNLGTVVSGMKYWKDDEEDDRPDSVSIHVYYKDDEGTEHELEGSPVEVKKSDNSGSDSWPWSIEIPLGSDAAQVDKDDFYIKEDSVSGYDSSVSGHDVTNTKDSSDDPDDPDTPDPPDPPDPPEPPESVLGKLTITAARAEADSDKEQSFVYAVSGPDSTSLTVGIVIAGGETSGSVTIAQLPAGDYTVTEERAWSWRYSDGSSESATVSDTPAEVTFDHTKDNNYWLNGYSHRYTP